MEASSQSGAGRGLWSNPRAAPYSQKTQAMLTLMMQEARLTNRQKKQINECLQNGMALPLFSNPTTSGSPPQPKSSKPVQKRLSAKPQKRTAECCRSGDSYVREPFRPTPTRDLEKEKRRLQNILATGQEEPTAASSQNAPKFFKSAAMEERDEYQEVLNEIEERRQFLADMASLGQERQYTNIINTEISQKIRELEVLDKARVQKDIVNSRKREETEEQIQNVDSKDTTPDSL